MSSKSGIYCENGVHIYHDWSDEGFVYAHVFDDPVKLCSLEQWYELVKYIKENEKDCNGKNLLNGSYGE